MASDNEASCVCDPNFAVICSFLEKFATSCGIAYPNFQELQEMLENSLEVPQPLIDLHVKLLRKSRKNVSVERWEKAVIKFCHSYSNQDGWEIERFGYKKARLAVKLNVLKTLLEQQFDMNTRFKAEVNRLGADQLRTQPLGRDKQGMTYWCQLDEDCNLRVYREDLDEETWDIVARDREGLVQLISQLTSDDPLHNGLDSTFNEDSNSLEIEKPITDTGQMDEEPEEEIEEEEGEVEEDNVSLLEDSDDNNVGEEIVAPKVKVSFKQLRQQTGHKELRQQTDDKELRQQTDDKELRQQTDDKELRQQTDDKELRQQTDDKELRQQTGANKIQKQTVNEKSFVVCETLAQKQAELVHGDKDTTAAVALDNSQAPDCLHKNLLELTHSNKLVQSVDEELPEVENSAEFIVECTEKTPSNDSSDLKSEHGEDNEESQNNTLSTKENKLSSEVTEKLEELKNTQDNCGFKKMEIEHSNVTVERVTDKNIIIPEEEDIMNKKHTLNEEQLKNDEEVPVEDKLKISISSEIACEKINLSVSKPLREPAVDVCENLSIEKNVEECIPVESQSNMGSVDGENKKNVSTKVVTETAEEPAQLTQPVQGRLNSEYGLASDSGAKNVDVHALQLKSFKEELKKFDTNSEVAKEDTQTKAKEEYKNTDSKVEPEIKPKSQEELKKFNFKSDVRTDDRPKVRDEFKKLDVKPEFRIEESRIKPVNFASLQHQMRVESKLDLRADLRSKQFGPLGSHQAGIDLSSARGMMFDKQSIRKQTPMLDLSRTRVENVGMDLSSKKSPEIPIPSNMSRKPDLKISHSIVNSGVCDLSTKKSPDKVMHPPSYDPGQSQSSYHFSSNIPLGIGALPHHLATDLTTRKSFTLNDFMNVRKEAVRNLATLSQIEKLTLLSQSIRPGEERKTFLTPEEISRGLKRDLREPGIPDNWLNKMGRYVEPSENRGSGSVHPSPVQVGEAIEEPLMLVRGEGSGRDCDTGNPGTDTQDSGSKVDKVDQNVSEDKVLPTNSVSTSDQSVVGLPDAETRELTGSVCITELQLPAFENKVTGNESVSLKVCVANAQICGNTSSKAHAENNEESRNRSDLENLNLLYNENKDVDKRDASIHLSHSFHTTVQNKTVIPEEYERGKSKFYDRKLTVQESTSTTNISDSLTCETSCSGHESISNTSHRFSFTPLAPQSEFRQPKLVPHDEPNSITLTESSQMSFASSVSDLSLGISELPSCTTKNPLLNASSTWKANDCQKISSAKSPHKLWSIEAICGPDTLKNTSLHPDSTSDVSSSVVDTSESVPVKPEKKWSLGVQVFEKSTGASAFKRPSRWDVGTPEKAKMEEGCEVVSSLNADHELERDSLDTTVSETANGSDEVPFAGSSEVVLDIEASSRECTTEKYLTEVQEQCAENDIEENVSSSERKEKLSPCMSASPKEPEILSVPDKNLVVAAQCFEQEKSVEDAHSSIEHVEENSIFDKATTFAPESSKSKADECNKSVSKFFFGPESLHTSLTDPATSSAGCVSNSLVAGKPQLNMNTLLQTSSKCILSDNHIHSSRIDALKNSTNLVDSGTEKFSFSIDKMVGHKSSTENLNFVSDDVQKEPVDVSSVRSVEVHRSQVAEVVERGDVAENAGADKVTHVDCEVDSVVDERSSNNDLSLQSETVVIKNLECSKKYCENKQEIEVNKEIGELLKTAESDCDNTCVDVDLSSSNVISLESVTDSVGKRETFDSVSHEDDNNAVLTPCTAVTEKDSLQQAKLPVDKKKKLVSDTVCEGINSKRKNENTESVKENIKVQECPDSSIDVLPDSCHPKEKSILSKNSVIIPIVDQPNINKVIKKLPANIVAAEKSKIEVPNSAFSGSSISALSKFHPQACVGKRRKSVESITMGIMMGKLSGKAGLELQSKITDIPLSGTQLLDRMLDFKGRNAKPERLMSSPPLPSEESIPVASPVAQQTCAADFSSDNSKTLSVPMDITESKEENDKFLTVESQLEAMMSDDPVPLAVGNQEVQNVSDKDACITNHQTEKRFSDTWYAADKQSTSRIKQQECGESSENLSDVERFVSETLIETTNSMTESRGESGDKTVEVSEKTSSTKLVADSSVCEGESLCNETERLSWVADLLDDCSRTSTGSHKNSSVSDGSILVNDGNQCNTESETCETKSLPVVEANKCSESQVECKGVSSTKPEILPKVTANIDEVSVSKNLDVSVDNSSKVQCQTDETSEKLTSAASNNKENLFSKIDNCDKSETQTENCSATSPPDSGKFSRKLAEGKKPQSESEHSSSIRLLEVLENSSPLEESDECLSREAEKMIAAAEDSIAAKDEKPADIPAQPQIQVGRLKVIPEASMASFMKSSLILCKEDPVSMNLNEKRNFIDLVGNNVMNSVAQGCKIPFVENKSKLLTFDPCPAAVEVNVEKTGAVEVNVEKTGAVEGNVEKTGAEEVNVEMTGAVEGNVEKTGAEEVNVEMTGAVEVNVEMTGAVEVNVEKPAALEEESVLSRVQAQLAVKLSTSSADPEEVAEKYVKKNKVGERRERVKKGKARGKKAGETKKIVSKVPAKNNLGEGLIEERLGNDLAKDGKESTNEKSKDIDDVLEIDGRVENEGSNNTLKEKMGAKFASLFDSNNKLEDECAQKTDIYPLKKPCTLIEFSMDYNPPEQIVCSPLPSQTMARPKPVGRNRRRSSKSADAKLGIDDKPITAQDDEKSPIVESEINDTVIPQRTTRSRNLRSGTAPVEFLSPVRRKRRSSKRLGSVSEDDEGTTGDVAKRKKVETGESTSKRRKLRGKKIPNLELRRSIEEQKRLEGSASSSEDEDHQVNIQAEDASTDDSQANASFRGRGRGGRGRSRGRGRGGLRGKGRGRVAQESKILLDSPAVSSDAPSEPPKPAAKKSRVSRLLKDLDLGAELIISNSAGPSSGMPVRQSRRIAQIKIKEEAERRRIEEMTLFVIKEEQISRSDIIINKNDNHEKSHDSQHSKSPRKRRKKHSDEDYIDEPEEQVVSKKQKRKKRKKKLNRLKFNENNPWVSSSGSSSSVEEEDEEEEEPEQTEDESNILFKSDHEFSPESDLGEDCDQVPVPRRARTAQIEVDSGEAAVADDHACQKCEKTDHPEWILLCDKCDHGWHGSCLRPALLVIPEGDWFCPPCEHTVLLMNLQERLREFDRCAKRRENEELRRKRLAYVGISLDNVLPNKDKDGKESDGDSGRDVKEKSSSSSDSGTSSSDESEPVYQLRERRQALFSYRFNEYDDLINSAIQDELEAVKGAGNQGRGKDIANIVNAEKSEPEQKLTNGSDETKKSKLDDSEDGEEEEEEEEEEGYIPPVKPKYVSISKKKHRRLNSLDISSEDDADSDEDFKGTSSEEEEEEEDEEADSDDSDAVRGSRRRSQPVRRSARARTTRFDREFINDDSGDSDYGPKRKKTRRLWVDSETEESDTWGHSKRRKSSGSHKSSHKSKSKKKKKKHNDDSGADSSKDKTKKRKVKFGGLDSVDDVPDMPRTRGRKMNYQEIVGSDSEEEILKAMQRKIDSDDEFVAAQEDIDEDDDEVVKAEEEEEDEDMENGHDDQEETVESSEEFISSKTNSKKAKEEKKSKDTKKKKPVKRREKKAKLRTVKTIRVKRVATPVESEEEVGGAEEEDDDDEELEDDGIPSMTEEEREMLEIEAQAEEEERMYLEEMEREALAAEEEQFDDEEEDGDEEEVLEEEEVEEEEEEEGEEDAVLAAEKAQLFVIKEAEKAKRAAKEERKRLKKEQKKFEKKEQKKLGKLAKQFEEAQAASADVVPKISSDVLGNTSSMMPPEHPAVSVTMQPPLAAIPTTPSYSMTCAQPHMPVREMPVGTEHKLEEGEVPITAVMSDAVAPVKPKRRGRGRGKATIAAAAAAAASAANEMGTAGSVPDGLQRFSVPQGYQPQLQTQTQPSPHSQIPSHSQSATPPQSTGSVITRMLQSQPVSAQSFTAAATAMGHKYFGGPPLVGDQGAGTGRGNGPLNQAQQYSMPRGRIPSPYRQPPPPLTNSPNGSPHYGRPPMNQLSQMRMRSQIPAGQPPQMYHTSHHPLDPSPSGGGPIAIAPNTSTGGSSPLHQPPAPSSSPLSNKAGHNTPPPPPYTRPTMTVPQSPGSSIPPPLVRYPLQGPEIISPATNGVRQQTNQYAPPSTAPSHLHQSQQQASRATIPPTPYPSYHPPPPPSYHYGAYPPPPPLAAADDALPPTAYQGSPYPDQYASSDQIQPSDGSNSKSYDDEGGGEFGGLVSYFSSQREDDLDT